jgi:putative DNA primase/helicase
MKCAVLGITHFAKNSGGRDTAERVIGSQAFSALARMVLATAKQEDSDLRVFTRAKSNISADNGGFHYTIEQVPVRSNKGVMLQTTRVVWGTVIEGTARSILSTVEGDDSQHHGKKMDEARAFLSHILANGPVAVTQVKNQAMLAGIASVTLQRAKESLNVQSSKTKGNLMGSWDWFLPEQRPALAPTNLL